MNSLFNKILIFLLFVHKGTTYTFKKYSEALLNSNDDCKKAFSSLDANTRFRFFDASGKIPVGILQGNINVYGAYDECLAINIPEKDVLGKYCTARLVISEFQSMSDNQYVAHADSLDKLRLTNNITRLLERILPVRNMEKGASELPYNIGICIPHLCGNESGFMKFDESLCVTSKTYDEMPAETSSALYIIIGFFIVAVISTIYDIIIESYQRDPHHDVLIAFSFYTNGRKLCRTSKSSNQLLCLNGLKTLNILWVIAGHTFGSLAQGPIDNLVDVYSWIQNYSSMLLAGATVSVDSFFTIGGLLSVYTLLRSKDPGMKSTIKSLPLVYLHRYLRLTPALAITVLIYWSGLSTYMADGPMWYIVSAASEPCKQSWWAALLYIQNYRNVKQCIGPSWYLSVDMQLFILSPLLWIPLRKWPRLTLRVMFGFVFLGIAIPFGIAFYYKLPATLIGYPVNGFMDVYYMKTHARFGTYVIGMITGYYIHKAKLQKKVYINPVALVWLWSLIIIVLYGCIYVGYPLITKEAPSLNGSPTDVDEATRWWNSIYIAIIRPAWSTALAVLIYLCVMGYGGPVNWFLSTGPMQFLAKLSYCMYLNHIIFINLPLGQTRTTFHFGNWEAMNILISIVVVMIPASIIQSLLFESPMICIEKIIFGRNKSPRSEENVSKTEA